MVSMISGGWQALESHCLLSRGRGDRGRLFRLLENHSSIIEVIIVRDRASLLWFDRGLLFLSRYWILGFALLFGLYVWLPFTAPVMMHWGWTVPARAVYFVYSFFCHQLPERSFFLFGPQRMYSLAEVQAAWQKTINPVILRQFIGNPQMGWKVAWSDRMVSMYLSAFSLGLLWWPFRKRIRPLPWWGLLLFLLPMGIDGVTHFLSDLAGLGQGFRATNAWLAALTMNALPPTFYAGDALGSFNSWMRLLTGLLFGIGVVWFSFPYLDEAFSGQARLVAARFNF
jgi:uncharacterized membrane protein